MVSNTARHITYGRDLHTIPINDLEEILHGFHAKAPGQWYADCPSCGATGDHFSIAEIDGRRIFYCHKCQDKAKVWDALLELINDDDTSDSNTPHKEDIPVSIIRVKTDAPNPALQWYAKYCYTTVDKLLELGIIEGVSNNESYVCHTWPSDLTSRAHCRNMGTKDITWTPGSGPSPDFWPMFPDTMPDTIYVTEGESDCTVLRTGGLKDAYAVTKGASGVPDHSYLAALKQDGLQNVFLVFDRDEPGCKGAKKLQAAFEAAGTIATSIDITPLINVRKYENDIQDARKHVGSNEGLVVRHPSF